MKLKIKNICCLTSMQWVTLLILLTLEKLRCTLCDEISSPFFYNKPEDTTDAEYSENSIPLEFYEKLDSISDMDSFNEQILGIEGNSNQDVERALAVDPPIVKCSPENTTVPLTPLNFSMDPSVIYFPSCTRVPRCGGCCSQRLMICEPTKTEIVNYKIYQIHFPKEKQPRPRHEIVAVEKHLQCGCQCRIKEKDCNNYQNYNKDSCQCQCNNLEAKEKCKKDGSGDLKIWDKNVCRCVCRDKQSCTSGTIFDENQCKCVTATDNGDFALLTNRRRYIVKAISVDSTNVAP